MGPRSAWIAQRLAHWANQSPWGRQLSKPLLKSSSPSKRIAIEPESRCEANRLHVQSHGWKGGFPDASDGRQTVLSNANTKVRDEENKVIEPI